ncbi:MAG: putative threonine ammonia-lyase, partial [Tardiphaga sp.]|nr:putative threonine ammonia-lyase [Tardiphaga sp.]
MPKPSHPKPGHPSAVVDLDSLPITPADVRAAAATIRGSVLVTACHASRTLSEVCGCNIWLKFENLQFTSTFKERGALNR